MLLRFSPTKAGFNQVVTAMYFFFFPYQNHCILPRGLRSCFMHSRKEQLWFKSC